jgi:2-keto-3-deoxy-galactonokinase
MNSSKRSRVRGSYITGDKGRNRVRLFPHPRDGKLLLEFRDEAGAKRRVSLGHADVMKGKIAANELAAELLKHEGTRVAELTLRSRI